MSKNHESDSDPKPDAADVTGTVDPTRTDHPVGEEQAAENESNESPG